VFLASAAAAGIHLGAVGEHLSEWVVSGLFMLAVGAYQFVWAISIARGARRDAVRAGAVVNAGIVGVWVLSRTLGLPFGPEPWMPEHIHAGDAIATALEVVLVAVVLGPEILRRPAACRVLVRLAAFGAVLSVISTSHGLPRESAIAAAALVLAGGLAQYVIVTPRLFATLTLGRDNDLIPFARLDPRARPAAGARVGVGRA
jgi:hypothetical protein